MATDQQQQQQVAEEEEEDEERGFGRGRRTSTDVHIMPPSSTLSYIHADRTWSAPSMIAASRGHVSELKILVPSRTSEKTLLAPERAKVVAVPPVAGILDFDEHLLSTQQLTEKFGTELSPENISTSKGLTQAQVEAATLLWGPNAMTPAPRPSTLKLYVHELVQPLNLMLLFAAVLSFIVGAVEAKLRDNTAIYLGLVLVLVTLANAAIDTVQAVGALKIVDGFRSLCPSMASVVRDGAQLPIFATEVVPGDLVNLTAGDKIPADLRIVESLGLKVDNSSLTGETEPQARGTSLRLSAGHSVLDAENIVFSGSLVCEGSAFGVAVRTGDRAIIGRIAALTTGGVGEEAGGRGRGARRASPLHEEIRSFVYLTGIIATSVASIFFAVGMAISPNFLTNFVFFIGVFVAFVPQGLPATVSMLLSFAAKEMAEEGVVVKDLHGVDTLGTINVLVCDKTGTMTQNKMTVVYTWLGDQDADPDFFLAGCGLCSRASFQATEENLALPPSKRVVMGDATESGILRYVAETVNVAELRENHKVLATVPFSSRLKWSAAVNKGPFKFSSAPACVFLKGAPERILERCSARLVGPQCQCVGIDDYFRHAMMNEWAIQAAMGRRTLAFAGLPLWDPPGTKYSQEPEPNFPLSSLIFLGLVGIEDPPKNGVAPAVRTCRDAGIRVAILTGDHPATALAIARQVGVVTGLTREEAAAEADDIQSVKPSQYSAEVVACGDLGTLSPADWDRILNKEEIVFARATPEDKLHITMRFQAKGNVVGVTGDGINDAPALKRADLGIAMGISGSEVSKEAADMVIMDDNFTSIVKGIERGRKVFTNLKRSIQYTLSHITPEVVPFLLYIAIGIPLPLNSFLVLMIDLVTELGPALSLAWEAADRGDMLKPPRKHAEAGDGLVILSHEVPAIVATLSNDGVPVSMQEVDLLEQRNASLIPRGMWRVGRGRRSCGSHVPANYHQKDEVLVDSTLLRWSYGFTGLLHTVAALSSYAMVFSNHGLGLSDLLGTARSHFGREFTSSVEIGSTVLSSEEQSKILREAQAAYFQTLVIGQCFANFVLKHRENHNGWKCFVAQPSLQQNPRTSIACAISVGLSFFLVFTPGLNTILSALPPLPLSPEIYLIAACEGLALMLLESLRRWLHGYLR